jgi:hypothetical protein
VDKLGLDRWISWRALPPTGVQNTSVVPPKGVKLVHCPPFLYPPLFPPLPALLGTGGTAKLYPLRGYKQVGKKVD